MIWIVCVALAFIYVGINVLLVAARNYKAHQFFKLKSPNIPVLPNTKLFSGHYLSLVAQDKNWKLLTDWHKQYGPTFGYYYTDQPWVSTKDLDLLKLIEVDQAHRHINRSNFGLPFDEFNHSIFQRDDDDWRRIRRAVSPALTNHKVRSEEVTSDINLILEKLHKSLDRKMEKARELTGKKSFVLDVHDTFKRYTLAVIFLVTYKKDNAIDFDAPHDQWTEDMEVGSRNVLNPIVKAAVMFPFLGPLCKFLVEFHTVGKVRAKITGYIIQAIDANRIAREQHEKMQRRLSLETGAKERSFQELKKQGDYKRRLVDTIIDAFIEKKINHDELVGSLFFLLLAGFETTADTITCLVWHLARNQSIQDKLRKAICEEGIDAEYVMWCIKETVRWHPAVPLGTGRILTEDVTVNGVFYAKGTFIIPSTHSIHHDPEIWPEPDEFKPERWHYASDFHPAAFMGFGLGPRNCVGGKMAVQEIKLVIQLLLTNYKIEKCDETTEDYNFGAPGLVYTLLDQPIKVRLVALDEVGKEENVKGKNVE